MCTIDEMKPTTNSSMTARPSMWIPKWVVLGPILNHKKRSLTAAGRMWSGPAGARWIHATAVPIASAKLMSTDATPTSEPLWGIFFPNSRMITKLRLGTSGMSQALVRNQSTVRQPFMTSTLSRSIEWRLR